MTYGSGPNTEPLQMPFSLQSLGLEIFFMTSVSLAAPWVKPDELCGDHF